MASSPSNTLLHALEIQEPPTHFEYNFKQDCCQRLLETCSCERPTTATVPEFPSTKLVKSTESWRSLPSRSRCTQLKKNLTWETSIYVNARPAACPLSVPRGEKQGFYFITVIDSRL